MILTTPQPWPEGTRATAKQMADWLVACTDAEREYVCGRMLDAQATASHCFISQHDVLVEQYREALMRGRLDYARGHKDGADQALAAFERALDRV